MDAQRLAMLWRGKDLIVLALAAMLLVGVVIIFAASKSYESTALLRVDQAATPANGSDAFNAEQASASQALSYATLLNSTSFLQRVSPKIDDGTTYSARKLADHSKAHAIKDTNLIAFTFSAGSRTAASHYAGTVAKAAIAAFEADFVAERSRRQAALQARLTAVAAKIAALKADTSPAAQEQAAALTVAQTNLTAEYGQSLSTSSSASPAVAVTGPPSTPGDPVSPRPLLIILIAILLGLLIGVALAWLRDRLTSWDRRTSSLAQALTHDPVAAAGGRAADRRTANKSDAAGAP
jgi:uncharacterized protein involved in exopolysaccharide biosynthesis